MKWTPEKKAEAARLWATGLDGPAIAARVGSTTKELYALTRHNRAMFVLRRRGANRLAALTKGASEGKAAEVLKIKPCFPDKAPGYDGVPRGRLTSCGCEFPLWGHHEDYEVDTSLFCGAPRIPDSRWPYCGFHALAVSGKGTPIERRAIPDAIAADAREAVAA
ncbi:hypothetical protein NL532_31985 [Mesorhizobium sp. C120A]|uniref:hypothetical protein n=1 Tax=unclassified Mesorhizobium TaxID=325217 RepID=UPI0003D01C1D|nr:MULTISPECIES: hypothetical protein [unclassified Mesorhizobium]ESZ63748.1 hypothetical protein X728_08970 [Mesorhizobium sp. L103C120A0]WJI45064.1 hypothetical protein NL532_31985 [Mesorhizobium sp. C120A]